MLQEQSIGIHYNTSGELLGYVVNKEAFDLERSRAVTDWRKPVWRSRRWQRGGVVIAASLVVRL